MSGPPPGVSGPPPSTGAQITQETLFVYLIITIAISVTFVLLRTVARWLSIRKAPVAAEDIAMYIALIAFGAQAGLYFAILPTLYKLIAVANGQLEPGPEFHQELVHMVNELMAQFNFFWLVLWSVKCSLLFMFKKLANGLPVYIRIWWCVLVFVILTYIGCVISDVVVYPLLFTWYTGGHADDLSHKAQIGTSASLWYAFTVDMLTDLLVMAIPLRLLWNLQISLKQKLGLAVIFTVGIITMCFAVVRAIDLNGAQSAGPSSTEWLIFWGAMEAMVAIIVGCLPSFAIFVRAKVAPRQTYDDYSVTAGSTVQGSKASQIRAMRTKNKLRRESTMIDDMELEDGLTPVEEVDRHYGKGKETIRVTKEWRQRWEEQE